MSICAVIVAYFPDENAIHHLVERLQGQVDQVLVVDNTPGGKSLREGVIGADVIYNGRNLGIAEAHNIGISWARARGFKYVLLLDQDSVPAGNMVQILFDELQSIEKAGIKVAAVGPQFINSKTGHVSPFIRYRWFTPEQVFCDTKEIKHLKVDFLISSGALIPVEVLDDVGDMDAALFIDHVDSEWVCRAANKGYAIFGVCGALMEHTLGEGGYRIWLGRWRYLPKYPPLRQYYIFRNSFLLYKFKHTPAIWISLDVIRLIYLFTLYMLVSDCRWTRIKMMIKGIYHGVTGRTGSIEEANSVG